MRNTVAVAACDAAFRSARKLTVVDYNMQVKIDECVVPGTDAAGHTLQLRFNM